MQWGEWCKSRNQSQREKNKVHLHWLFHQTRREMKATYLGRMRQLGHHGATERAGLPGWKVHERFSLCVYGCYPHLLSHFTQAPRKVGLEHVLQMSYMQLLRMDTRQETGCGCLGAGFPRTVSQCVGTAPRSVQLTYFKNGSIKRISKFPLWTYLELKIPWGLSWRKSQNEAKLLDFTWFISCRRAQLLPENKIFFSIYCLHFYLSGRSNRTLTTQKIQ